MILALVLLLASALASGAALTLQPGQATMAANGRALYYDDPPAGLTAAEAAAATGRFLAADRRLRAPGATLHWLRLPVVNAGAEPSRWLLTLGVPDARHLELYRVDGDRVTRLVDLPGNAEFARRPVPARLLALPFELAPGEATELLLGYRTHADTPLHLTVSSPVAFQDDLALDNLVNGALMGLLLALALFALLQYLAAERIAFLAYGIMTLLAAIFMAQFEGYTFAYLWPGAGSWNQVAPACLAVAMQMVHALFALSLFDLRPTRPRLYRLFLAYLALPPVALGLYLFKDWTWPLLLAALAYLPLVLGAGLVFLRRDRGVAGFFLAGTVTYALFTNILFGLGVYGLLGDTSPFVFPKVGYLFEAVLFALALARQVHTLRCQVEYNLRQRLREAELLARAETDKRLALQAAQDHRLRLAATGHDLSQPLASMRFALTALRQRPENEAATRHIDETLDYTETLLRTLLDEARREHAQRTPALALDGVLADAWARHLPAAGKRGLALRRHRTALRLPASEVVLTRILDNLLGNAVRHTVRGAILLGVRRRPDGLEIQVLDTGPGLPDDQRQRLLRPFEQGEAAQAGGTGHGLGLHIVRTLCEESGYRLAVRSRPGRGSTFGVLIPFGV